MATTYRGVHDGTQFGDPLCPTCRHAQYIQGQSLSCRRLTCMVTNKRLPFEAYECSSYDDKRLPSRWDMEQIAWVFVTNVKTKRIGFVSANEYRKLKEQAGASDQPAPTTMK